MLKYNLEEIFKMRGIAKPYAYMLKAGISPFAASQIATGNTKSLNLKHVELLCKVLYCLPSDLLVWIPDEGSTLPDTHPLTKLKRSNTNAEVANALKTLPLEELRKVTKLISESGGGKSA